MQLDFSIYELFNQTRIIQAVNGLRFAAMI